MSDPARRATELGRLRQAYASRTATDYGDRYSYFNPGNLFVIQERERLVLSMLRAAGYYPLHDKRIVEVGCGSGFWLRAFVQWGAAPERLWGVDLEVRRLAEARRLCPLRVRLVGGEGARAPLRTGAFDLVLLSTVFTSILDEQLRQELAAEMMRLVSARGMILWYDFRYDNVANPDVRGIGTAKVRDLFKGWQVAFRSLTLAPPLVRRIAPMSWTACRLLSLIPPLRTHLLAVIRQPSRPVD